jgi:hypothetical protein
MVAATTLSGRLASAVKNGLVIPQFTGDVISQLEDAAEEFSLAPDEWIDVKRLPAGVVDLPSLINHLRAIQNQLGSRPSDVKTADWDVAKSGSLRLYKLAVCCITGLVSYIDASPIWNVSIKVFVAACMMHAKANAPGNLAAKGKTLWTKTFEDGSPRTVSVMTALVFLCHGSSTGVGAPPAPPATGSQKTGAQAQTSTTGSSAPPASTQAPAVGTTTTSTQQPAAQAPAPATAPQPKTKGGSGKTSSK